MSQAVRWAGASAGSVALHGAALALLLVSFDPEPPGAQSPPPSVFEVVATAVRSETAAALAAEAEAVAAADPDDTRIDGGMIPSTSGRAIPLVPDPVVARVPEGLAPAVAPRPPVSAPSRPQAPRLAPSSPAGSAMAAVDLPPTLAPAVPLDAKTRSQSLASADPARTRIEAMGAASGPVLRPEPAPVATVAAMATEQPAEAAQPLPAERTEAGIPAGPSAAELSLPSTETVAALAWTGDAATIDPKSVAAVSAFLSPGRVGAGSEVRDRVSAALSAIDCARLQTAFDPANGALEVRGHVPEADLRATITAALTAEIGGAIPVVDRLQVLPRPQCGLLGLIEAVGLAQSDEQALDPRIIGPDTHVRDYRYGAGDRLVLDVLSPSYPSVIYIDYFDASGTVLHLQPNETIAAETVPADTALSVGAERPGQPSLELTVGPPYGQEIAVAFAVSHPLYEGLRPLTEPAEGYLAFLRARVAEARSSHPDFKGEWVYFFVSTRERW